MPSKPDAFPEWDDDFFSDDDGDSRKTMPEKKAAKALFNKWRDLAQLVYAFMDSVAVESEDDAPETQEQLTRRFIFENMIAIGPKIRGAAGTDLYILKMENASIIRTNVKQLMQQVSWARIEGYVPDHYCDVIENAIEEFRLLFRDWAATFKKDEYEDEWGLYT